MAQSVASETFPELQVESAAEYGLKEDEWLRIQEGLGRNPNTVEAEIFGRIWSEDYAKKSCRGFLKSLFRGDESVIRVPSSEIKAVPLNGDTAIVASVYANNSEGVLHPAAGTAAQAATAISGLMRVGAEPLALLPLQRFGSIDSTDSQLLFQESVRSLSQFSNRIGVPVVAGDLFFHHHFGSSLMSNVCAVGTAPVARLKQYNRASLGSFLVYIGAPTADDAPLHSRGEEHSEQALESALRARSSDPLILGRLLQAAQESFNEDLICDWIPLLAGGLSAALFEITSRHEIGLRVDLDGVPLRVEKSLEPLQIIRSETVGRAVAVVEKSKHRQLTELLNQYKFKGVVIGEVIDSDDIEVSWLHNLVGLIPHRFVLDKMTERKYQLSKYPPMLKRGTRVQNTQKTIEQRSKVDEEWAVIRESTEESGYSDIDEVPVPKRLQDIWVDLLADPNLCSRRHLQRMFDPGARGVLVGTLECAVLRYGQQGVALTSDANSLFVSSDPYLGAVLSVSEAMRNITCVGARPLAAIDCINAGSPARYKELSDLAEVVRGLNDACSEWNVPLLTDEVDLENGTEANPTLLTPGITMVGVVDDYRRVVPMHFVEKGDRIMVLGQPRGELGASEYLSYTHKSITGEVPELDFAKEQHVAAVVRAAIGEGLIRSCHDVSTGGVAVALAESCIAGSTPLGASVRLTHEILKDRFRADGLLFSEQPGQYVISCSAQNEVKLFERLQKEGVPVYGQGEVGGKVIRIEGDAPAELTLSTAYRIWRSALADVLGIGG